MELRQLRYFVRVAELKSFSRASLDLNVAQPAVSRQVRKLEEQLGVPLLRRDGRGASLTEAGACLLVHATEVLDRLERAGAELQYLKQHPTGDVCLGVPPHIGAFFVMSTLIDFDARFSSAKVRIVEGFSPQIAEWLQSGAVEVGLLYNCRKYPHIRPILEVAEQLSLVGKAGDPVLSDAEIRFSALPELPLVSALMPSYTRACLDEAAKRVGLTLRFDYEVDSLPTLKALAATGRAYVALPWSAVRDELAAGTVAAARIIDPEVTLFLGLGLPVQGILTPAAKGLIALLEQEIRAAIDSGDWLATLVREPRD
jgi:LysR family nitrogen assimilation transcriptional regulator